MAVKSVLSETRNLNDDSRHKDSEDASTEKFESSGLKEKELSNGRSIVTLENVRAQKDTEKGHDKTM